MRIRTLLLGVALGVATAGQTAAEGVFVIAADDGLSDTADQIVQGLTASMTEQPRCPIHLVVDSAGTALLSADDTQRFQSALETSFRAAAFDESCAYVQHDLTRDDAAAPDATALATTLDQEDSLVVISYFASGSGLVALPKMLRADGGILSFSGPVDLPVRRADETVEQGEPIERDEALADVESEPDPPVVNAGPVLDAELAGLRLHGSAALADGLMVDLAVGFLKSQIGRAEDTSVAIETVQTPEGDRVVRLLRQPSARLQSISIRPSGENQGFDDLLTARADVIFAQRAIRQTEYDLFESRHQVDMRARNAEFVIGFDLLQFLVNPRNTLPEISRAMLAGIYSHELTRWTSAPLQLSGLDGEIDAIGPGGGYRAMEILRERVMAGDLASYRSSLDSGAEVATLVAGDENAIGFVGLNANGKARSLDIEECGTIYSPDPFLVRTEDHPLSIRLHVYVNPGTPDPDRDAFTTFLMSEKPGEGQDIIGENYVNLKQTESDDRYTSWRWRTAGELVPVLDDRQALFRQSIINARRLSTTFRFRFDSDRLRLDSRGESGLERLIGTIQSGEIDLDDVLLVGFADAIGDADYNVALAERRARAVADRLRAAGLDIPDDGIVAIGEDAPVACSFLADDEIDNLGLDRNRRVEVWLR